MTTQPGRRIAWREWTFWFAVLIGLTALMRAFRGDLNEAHVTLAYLLVVQGGSARAGRPLGLALSIAAFLAFDFFFLPPFGTMVIQNPLNWLVLFAFLATAVLSAQLLYRARAEADVARNRAAEIDRLAALGAETLSVGRAEDALAAIVDVIRVSLPIDGCAVFITDTASPRVTRVAGDASGGPGDESHRLVDWVAAEGLTAGELSDGTARVDVTREALLSPDGAARLRAYVRPLRVRERTVGVLRIASTAGLRLSPAELRVLDALSYYAALGVERVRLGAEADRAAWLQEAHRAKDAVLASVSHDLRTPLTTIKGLAHEIGADGDERAAVIEEEADRLTTFVAQLLDLSRINSGAAASDVQLNEAEDLLGAAAQAVAGRMVGRELRIHATRNEALLFGRFDFSQTLRALVNLVENAAKYSPPGAPVELSVKREGGSLVFSVADRGPGVPLEERERIFEPFYRHGDAAAHASGTGLGLAIARGIARAQGGDVTVESREGGGSIFHVFVPAVTDRELEAMVRETARNS